MATICSPRDLLPPNAGVIDSLKRKFTPLPSLRRGEDFAFPPPSLPPPPRRERDVFEERHRQHHHQQASDLKHYSSSSCDDKSSSYNSGSSAPNTARDKTSDHRGAGHDYSRSRKKSRSLDRDTLLRDTGNVLDGYYTDARGHFHSNQDCVDLSCERCVAHQCQSSEHNHDPFYSGNYDGEAARGSRDLVGAADGYQRENSHYGHNIRCRERPDSVSRSHDFSHDRLSGTARERHGHSRRSRSLEKFRERPRDPGGGQVREPEHSNARDRSRETYRGKTHSCSQSSHHRSYCDCRERQASTEPCSSRHSRADNRDREANSGYSHVSGSFHPKVTKPQCKSQGCSSSESESHSKMLSDIPPMPQSKVASNEHKPSGNTQGSSNPQHPATPKKSPSNNQTLRQQVSPLSSRRLRKVRYRSNRYFLNILENGEVCLEHLSGRHNQELVDDVCRISPDGLRVWSLFFGVVHFCIADTGLFPYQKLFFPFHIASFAPKLPARAMLV